MVQSLPQTIAAGPLNARGANMAKYLELPDDFDFEQLGELKDKVKPFEPEDVSGLKNSANKLLSEKKAMEAQLAEAQAEIKKAKLGAKNEGEVKGLEALQAQLEDAKNKLKEKDDAYNNLLSENKKSQIMTEASKIAASLTKDTRRAGLLAEKIGARIDFDNGKPVVLDGSGNPTISTLDELSSSIRKEYDFLVDASQASGGGAQGGSGGAAKTKEVTRSTFDSMSHADRATFAKEGGKVISD